MSIKLSHETCDVGHLKDRSSKHVQSAFAHQTKHSPASTHLRLKGSSTEGETLRTSISVLKNYHLQ